MEKFGTKKKYYRFVVPVMIITVASSFLWLKEASSFLKNFEAAGHGSAMEKVNYIFNHPMGMLSRIYLTIIKYGEALVWEIFGSQLAVRTVYIHPIFYFWYCFKVIEAGREFRLGEKENNFACGGRRGFTSNA